MPETAGAALAPREEAALAGDGGAGGPARGHAADVPTLQCQHRLWRELVGGIAAYDLLALAVEVEAVPDAQPALVAAAPGEDLHLPRVAHHGDQGHGVELACRHVHAQVAVGQGHHSAAGRTGGSHAGKGHGQTKGCVTALWLCHGHRRVEGGLPQLLHAADSQLAVKVLSALGQSGVGQSVMR